MSALVPVGLPESRFLVKPEHRRYLSDPDFIEFCRRQRRKTKPQIRWTPERVQFLKDHRGAMILSELTRAFNEHFSLTVTEKSIAFQLTWRGIFKVTKRRGVKRGPSKRAA